MLERHPYASDAYSRGFEGDGLARLEVPPWRSYVLVRCAASDPSVRTASGLYPYASLEPDCDLAAGLDLLRARRCRHVPVLRLAAEQQIAHTATGEQGAVPGVAQAAGDAVGELAAGRHDAPF